MNRSESIHGDDCKTVVKSKSLKLNLVDVYRPSYLIHLSLPFGKLIFDIFVGIRKKKSSLVSCTWKYPCCMVKCPSQQYPLSTSKQIQTVKGNQPQGRKRISKKKIEINSKTSFVPKISFFFHFWHHQKMDVNDDVDRSYVLSYNFNDWQVLLHSWHPFTSILTFFSEIHLPSVKNSEHSKWTDRFCGKMLSL